MAASLEVTVDNLMDGLISLQSKLSISCLRTLGCGILGQTIAHSGVSGTITVGLKLRTDSATS
jgi:hypothetical protein